jgi:hypothetical protein
MRHAVIPETATRTDSGATHCVVTACATHLREALGTPDRRAGAATHRPAWQAVCVDVVDAKTRSHHPSTASLAASIRFVRKFEETFASASVCFALATVTSIVIRCPYALESLELELDELLLELDSRQDRYASFVCSYHDIMIESAFPSALDVAWMR